MPRKYEEGETIAEYEKRAGLFEVKLDNGISAYVVNPEQWDDAFGGLGGSDSILWFLGSGYVSLNLITFGGGWDDGSEMLGEYLKEHFPGELISDEEMAELQKEARDELGPDASDEEVWEQAEADLMYTESGWLTSSEVNGREIEGDELADVLEASRAWAIEHHPWYEDDEPDEEDDEKFRKEIAGLRGARGKNPPQMTTLLGVFGVGLVALYLWRKK